ncbi:helix-turn-helix domain-containing protein [Croceimicrobium hydrocarbonivorans]|uniref:helix-turn-helix domain-containing protein n=1 Tax=Croceimicrobium hydrocarbonivorans TaxID=2761580 RepID=UPI001FE7BA99|nr:helix-turn-helix transcriptional regulator [Croceimicrobium hydrocarbonivorans]
MLGMYFKSSIASHICSLKRTQYKKDLIKFGIVNKSDEKYLQFLGSRIKELREIKGLDQKAFAFHCDIGRTQLHKIEKAETNPRVLTLLKIAAGLEISLAELLKD